MMILFTDASVSSNHGVGIGWHIQTQREDNPRLYKTVTQGNDFISSYHQSVTAELLAMVRGVKEALQQGERTELEIKTDCDPLVDKVQARDPLTDDGRYMEALYDLLSVIDEWSVEWVKRDKNSFADGQAGFALDQHA